MALYMSFLVFMFFPADRPATIYIVFLYMTKIRKTVVLTNKNYVKKYKLSSIYTNSK